jgi:hypothetical protein
MRPYFALAAALAYSCSASAGGDLMSAEQRAWLVAAGRGGGTGSASSGFPPLSANQATQLYEAEEAFFETYYSYHQAWAQYANPHYTSKTDRSKVLEWDELGDSACWSGHQLAALAFRYNATGGDATTLGRIGDSLGAFENLTAVSGKPGFMARFMGRADDAAYQGYYCQHHQPGQANCSAQSGDNWFHGAAGHEEWVFLDSLSRDAYFGAALGLVSVHQKVEHAATHARVSAILRLMVSALHKDKWWIISPNVGKTKKVVPVNPVPSFIALWQKIALVVDPEQYGAELGPKYRRMLDLAVRTDYILEGAAGPKHSQTGVSKFPSSYFGANLCIISATALALLQNEGDPDTAATAQVHTALAEIVSAGYDHLSASFPSHFLAASSAATRASPAGRKQADMLRATLLDFAGVEKWNRHADLRNVTQLEPHCVVKGLACAVLPAGSAECDASCDAVNAFPASQRAPTDYQWQRSPVQLVSGNDDTAHEFSAIDMMLPYWMGRAAGVIPAPAAEEYQ